MNDIQKLREKLKYVFPTALITIDEAREEGGVWFLDLSLSNHFVTVAWSLEKGFGLNTKDHCYGEGAGETFNNIEDVLYRIVMTYIDKTDNMVV